MKLADRSTIAEEWALYKLRVIPANASSVQVIESRRAFYAGAQAFFGLITRGLDPGTDATEPDLTYVKSLDDELKAFASDVEAGRA